MKYHKIIPLVTLLGAALNPLNAQLQSNGTGGGTWDDPSSWATAVPTTGQTFSVQASDTIEANNLGVIQSNNGNSYVYGTLTVGTGTSISMARLNNGVISSGTLNISGGDMSISRFSQSSGSNFTVNLSSGSFQIRDAIAITSSTYTFNISGGVFDSQHGSLGNGSINLTGGTFLMRSNLSGAGSLYNGSWNGGTIALIGTTSNNTAATTLVDKWGSNSNNILRPSISDTAESLTLTANTNVSQGILSLGVYSGTNDDNDKLAVGAGISLTLGEDVIIDISGINLTGNAEDLIGSSYQFFEADSFAGIAATVDETVFNIDGTDYYVNWINTLSTDGRLTIGAIAIPEPSTYALIFGFLMLGFTAFKRFRKN